MSVRIERQAEVADVIAIVDSLLHGAQQHGLDKFLIRATTGFADHRSKIGRRGALYNAVRDPYFTQIRGKRGQPVRIRLVVHAKQ